MDESELVRSLRDQIRSLEAYNEELLRKATRSESSTGKQIERCKDKLAET